MGMSQCVSRMSEPQVVDLLRKLLDTIEKDIYPLTQTQVKLGDRVFGASVNSSRAPYSTIVFDTNRSHTAHPLQHSGMACIQTFYALMRKIKEFELGSAASSLQHSEFAADPKDCIFLSTHELSPLDMSAVSYAGFGTVFYLFSHQDSADDFNMPTDLQIMQQVFDNDGSDRNPYYRKNNDFFEAHSIRQVIRDSVVKDVAAKKDLQAQIERIKKLYAVLAMDSQCAPRSKL